MKTVFLSRRIKNLVVLCFSFTATLVACGQDTKSKKGKIDSSGKVNMKELQEKEKKNSDTLKKTKFKTGPIENTQSKPLPVPKDAKVIKTEITPGQMKRDSTRQKNKKKDSTKNNSQ